MKKNSSEKAPRKNSKNKWKRYALGIVCLLGAISTAVLFVLDLKSGYLRRAVTSAIATIVLLGYFVQAFPPKDESDATTSENTDDSSSERDDDNA